MSRRVHLTFSDSQHEYLVRASERTSLSVAELVRRAIDEKYPGSAPEPSDQELTIAVWRRPAASDRGRRSGVSLD